VRQCLLADAKIVTDRGCCLNSYIALIGSIENAVESMRQSDGRHRVYTGRDASTSSRVLLTYTRQARCDHENCTQIGLQRYCSSGRRTRVIDRLPCNELIADLVKLDTILITEHQLTVSL